MSCYSKWFLSSQVKQDSYLCACVIWWELCRIQTCSSRSIWELLSLCAHYCGVQQQTQQKQGGIRRREMGTFSSIKTSSLGHSTGSAGRRCLFGLWIHHFKYSGISSISINKAAQFITSLSLSPRGYNYWQTQVQSRGRLILGRPLLGSY